MIYVFLSGCLGFLAFDAYRVRLVWERTGAVILIFRTAPEFLMHLMVYLAAGIIAVGVNIDVLLSHSPVSFAPPLQAWLLGPIGRGFMLGLAGSAGISKGRVAPTQTHYAEGSDQGDMAGGATVYSRAVAALKFLFLR